MYVLYVKYVLYVLYVMYLVYVMYVCNYPSISYIFYFFVFFCSACVCVCAIVFNQWLKTVPTRAASIWRFTARVGASLVKVPEVSRCGMFI